MNRDIEIDDLGHFQCWPTPILEADLKDADCINAGLLGLIHDKARGQPGITTSNRGAWQSQPDFLCSDHPSVIRLTAAIQTAAEVMSKATDIPQAPTVAEAWAIVYRDGDFQSVHTHPGAAWSGVYYVSCAAPAATGSGTPKSLQGCLELFDPRTASATRSGQSSSITIAPRSGLLVCFPSWVDHWVRPVQSTQERVCVAFNVGYGARTDA